MIQRFQTIFLFLASFFLLLTTMFPLTRLFDITNNTLITMSALKIEVLGNPISATSKSVISTGIVLYFTTLLGFISIFLYKNRKLQMLVSSIAMAFSFLICNMIVITSYKIMPSAETSLSFTIYAIFPIIALIFFFLAYKAIKKDDKLVKSLDRIR